jgi:hypothetical protein
MLCAKLAVRWKIDASLQQQKKWMHMLPDIEQAGAYVSSF